MIHIPPSDSRMCASESDNLAKWSIKVDSKTKQFINTKAQREQMRARERKERSKIKKNTDIVISTSEWRHNILWESQINQTKPKPYQLHTERKLRPTKSIVKLLKRLQLFFYQLLRSVLFIFCLCARVRKSFM